MSTKYVCGQIVKLNSAAGVIERIVVRDRGNLVGVCTRREFQASKDLMIQPLTVFFKKRDVLRH